MQGRVWSPRGWEWSCGRISPTSPMPFWGAPGPSPFLRAVFPAAGRFSLSMSPVGIFCGENSQPRTFPVEVSLRLLACRVPGDPFPSFLTMQVAGWAGDLGPHLGTRLQSSVEIISLKTHTHLWPWESFYKEWHTSGFPFTQRTPPLTGKPPPPAVNPSAEGWQLIIKPGAADGPPPPAGAAGSRLLSGRTATVPAAFLLPPSRERGPHSPPGARSWPWHCPGASQLCFSGIFL